MAEILPSGLVDLEKELTCSICTEILYQPLTLLDCLHTFCGSCLKLWFVLQASHNRSIHNNPYTCPSCRAAVRGTRPDAKITTLLDLYLQANPSKGKTQEEKDDIKTKYTPGQNVIPKPASTRRTDVEDADQRLVDEARAASLREIEAPRTRSHDRNARHAPRSRERQPQEQSSTARQPPGRSMGHQSSLRSLISNSDVESGSMEEEILRQIMEDGLLDGIDLHHMTSAQEDELSERIADAYRRRHQPGARERSRETRETRNSGGRERATSSSQVAPPSSRSGTRQSHSRSASASDQQAAVATSSATQQRERELYPPVSRPHLLEAYPTSTSSHPRRRTASESRGQPRRSTAPVSGSSNVAHQAARSATDLSTRPRQTAETEERPLPQVTAPSNHRRATDPRGNDGGGSSQRDRTQTNESRPSAAAAQTTPSGRSQSDHYLQSASTELRERDRDADAPERVRQDSAAGLEVVPPTSELPSSLRGAHERAAGLYEEPNISCDRCTRPNIQYEVHYYCPVCNEGSFSLCKSCYRSGAGCPHWFGFGNAALQRFQQMQQQQQQQDRDVAMTAKQDPPHALIGRQYSRPRSEAVQSVRTSGEHEHRILTTDDPASRLRSGVFCYMCAAFANYSFWQCESCNDGEWGYCTSCVNQGKCCTHALLPLAQVDSSKTTIMQQCTTSNIVDLSLPPTSSAAHMVHKFPPQYSHKSAQGHFKPLRLTIQCSVCHTTIPSDQNRYHCNACKRGDYDVCEPCYSGLVDSGQISRANGPHGWRRCVLDHRMVMYVFQSTPQGQKRFVTRHLVGGLFLEDQRSGDPAHVSQEVEWYEEGERKTRTVSRLFSSSQRNGVSDASQTGYPPDGGVGLIVVARWAWLPPDGADDNLSFPRGAEIREVVETHRDWYVGTYAGAKGVFPSAYVRTVAAITIS